MTKRTTIRIRTATKISTKDIGDHDHLELLREKKPDEEIRWYQEECNDQGELQGCYAGILGRIESRTRYHHEGSAPSQPKDRFLLMSIFIDFNTKSSVYIS